MDGLAVYGWSEGVCMNMKRLAALGLFAGFGVSALADNPISSYHYLADPSRRTGTTILSAFTPSRLKT